MSSHNKPAVPDGGRHDRRTHRRNDGGTLWEQQPHLGHGPRHGLGTEHRISARGFAEIHRRHAQHNLERVDIESEIKEAVAETEHHANQMQADCREWKMFGF